MIQQARFTTGGFVLHKIEGDYKGKMSAWFSRDGILIDAEQIAEPFGHSRKVRVGGPMWRHAQKVGNRYKHIPTA